MRALVMKMNGLYGAGNLGLSSEASCNLHPNYNSLYLNFGYLHDLYIFENYE
jgi:hypothetical protein